MQPSNQMELVGKLLQSPAHYSGAARGLGTAPSRQKEMKKRENSEKDKSERKRKKKKEIDDFYATDAI